MNSVIAFHQWVLALSQGVSSTQIMVWYKCKRSQILLT